MDEQETHMITYEQLQKDFIGLGIKDGDHVHLMMSYKSIGGVSGGPKTFIEALLGVVGLEGTIMMATYTPMYHLSRVRHYKVPVFKKGETPAYTGIIAEYIRKDVRAIRSNHPTSSCAAIGGKAEYLLSDHDHNAPAYSPFSKLAEINGKALDYFDPENFRYSVHFKQI